MRCAEDTLKAPEIARLSHDAFVRAVSFSLMPAM